MYCYWTWSRLWETVLWLLWCPHIAFLTTTAVSFVLCLKVSSTRIPRIPSWLSSTLRPQRSTSLTWVFWTEADWDEDFQSVIVNSLNVINLITLQLMCFLSSLLFFCSRESLEIFISVCLVVSLLHSLVHQDSYSSSSSSLIEFWEDVSFS